MPGKRIPRPTENSARRYSLAEIDAMRGALRCWCEADINFPGGDVEVILRTYMINGSTPEDVIAHAEANEAAAWDARRRP